MEKPRTGDTVAPVSNPPPAAAASDARHRSSDGNHSAAARNAAAGSESVADKLSNPFVFVTVLYLLVIGFTLATRGKMMSLVNGKPIDGVTHASLPGPDKWDTTSTFALLATGVSFGVVTLAHLYLIAHLVMRHPAGVPTMGKLYSLFVPGTLTLATFCYYLQYLSLTRYGVDHREWIIFVTSSTVLFFGSAILTLCALIKQKSGVVIPLVPASKSALLPLLPTFVPMASTTSQQPRQVLQGAPDCNLPSSQQEETFKNLGDPNQRYFSECY